MKIYLVATIKDIQSPAKAREAGTYGIAEVYGARTIGYALTLDEAKKWIKQNVYDIHENYYKYALIEEVAPGIYTATEAKSFWFKWTKNGYRPIQKPGQLKQIVGFTIG